jgi:hypothetical protein
MSMNRSASPASASSPSFSADSGDQELILVIEGMHLGRGRNDSTLNKISQGYANKGRRRYIVVHLPLETHGGGSEMRAEVARQTHLLIQKYQPHRVIIATDYNIGTSGGACTLKEFSEFLTSPSEDLMLPRILIDGQSARAARGSVEQAQVKDEHRRKNLILISYVLFGGNLSDLNAACEEFADGRFSHWTAWRGIMSRSMRPSTPEAKSLTTRQQAPAADVAGSTPSLTTIDELGNTPISSGMLNMGEPELASRTRSLPTQTSSSPDQALMSPPFSDSRSPRSFDGSNFSPESLPPSVTPEAIAMGGDSQYELTHIAESKSESKSKSESAPEALFSADSNPMLLPPAARLIDRRPVPISHHYHELIEYGHLDIPKNLMFKNPKKLREFARRNSLEEIKLPSLNLDMSAPPMPATSPAVGFTTPARITTSQTKKGSPAGLFARRLAAIAGLRVDVSCPHHEDTPDFDESPAIAGIVRHKSYY